MKPVTEKYYKRSMELAMQHKTGYECPYCGISETQENRYGIFCAGCGIERHKELAKCFGVPVFDPDDVIALMKEMEGMLT